MTSEMSKVLNDDQISELLLAVHGSGCWEDLSPELQDLGKTILKEAGVDWDPKGKDTSPRFSAQEHADIIAQVHGLGGSESDFWLLVVQIVWTMIAVESDPTLAHALMGKNETVRELSAMTKVRR